MVGNIYMLIFSNARLMTIVTLKCRHFLFANATISFKQLVESYPGPLALVSILVGLSPCTKYSMAYFCIYVLYRLSSTLFFSTRLVGPIEQPKAVQQEGGSAFGGNSDPYGALQGKKRCHWAKGLLATLLLL